MVTKRCDARFGYLARLNRSLEMSALFNHSEIQTLASGIDHSEGLCVGLQGEIYLGSESGKIYRVTLDGELSVVAQSSAAGILLGLSIRSNGNLLVCDAAAKTIWEVDLERNIWRIFCNQVNGQPLNLPNWGCFLSDGSYVFSDSGDWKKSNGSLIRVDVRGNASIWSTNFPNFPNGIALSADGKELFVLESTPGCLHSIEINNDYSAGNPKVLCEMEAVPDGVTVTTSGALIISCYRPDVIYLWNNGDLQILVEDVEGTYVAAPTNTVLAGANRDLLIWPNFGRWELAKLQTNLVGIPILIF